MQQARAAIYVRATTKQAAQSQITQLKHTITNNGGKLASQCVFTDTGDSTEQLNMLLEATKARQFSVLYVDYSLLPTEQIKLVRELVRSVYIFGLSAIVCQN